jgi:hypothetical protein
VLDQAIFLCAGGATSSRYETLTNLTGPLIYPAVLSMRSHRTWCRCCGKALRLAPSSVGFDEARFLPSARLRQFPSVSLPCMSSAAGRWNGCDRPHRRARNAAGGYT